MEYGGCIEFKVVSGARDVHRAGEAEGFSVVCAFGKGKFFHSRLNAVGDFHQPLTAFGGRECAPCGKGCFCCGHCCLYILGIAARDGAVGVACGWVDVVHGGS